MRHCRGFHTERFDNNGSVLSVLGGFSQKQIFIHFIFENWTYIDRRVSMGKGKRKAVVKPPKQIKKTDSRLRESYKSEIVRRNTPLEKRHGATWIDEKKPDRKEEETRRLEQTPSALFFSYNDQLGPPYHVLIDTNFINFSIQNKMDMFKGMLDLLLGKVFICVSDCVIGELEKNHRYRLALRIAKDHRIKRLTCCHKGTYADDCIVDRVTEHRCYIVATNDKDLRNRIRKVPGVPIMGVAKRKYVIERMPDSMANVPLSGSHAFKL